MRRLNMRRVRAIVNAAVLAAVVLFSTHASSASRSDTFAAMRAADLRLASIGYRLAKSNAALCDLRQPGTGLVLHSIEQFGLATRPEAQAYFGFATPLAVEAVVAGSPAQHADIRVDDAIRSIGTIAIDNNIAEKASTTRMIQTHAAIAALPPDQPLDLIIERQGRMLKRTIIPTPACRTRFEVEISQQYIARADGEMVQIGVRNLEEYSDNELAVTVAHELSHNILRHRKRLTEKGVDFGVLSGFGPNVKFFRQTEMEADILSVYLLVNAGYDPNIAVDFWRRIGPKRSAGIFDSRSHPDWRDRLATIRDEALKVEATSKRPITPELLHVREKTLDGDWERLIVKGTRR